MKINRLILNNFSSFEGVTEFNLAPEKGKNIILVGGKNGAGKTSLFTAIKLALYGPMTYGYVSSNAFYIARIKELINTKTYHKNKVEASVTVEIEVLVEREKRKYSISRVWVYEKQKLTEECIITKNGSVISGDEHSYFQNYLMNVIPPTLFDFFFFDGEEVGNIFSSTNYNSYVKKAVHTMCGLDVFEILRKNANGYIAQSSTEKTVDESEYEQLGIESTQLEADVENLQLQISFLKDDLESVEVEQAELLAAFQNAGGITEVTRRKLEKELADCEKTKQENSIKVKAFVEGLMPFFILKDVVPEISAQLEVEEKGKVFASIKSQLTPDVLKDSSLFFQNLASDEIEQICNGILDVFNPSSRGETLAVMYGLSDEDKNRVLAMIASISYLNIETILEAIGSKQKATARTTEINKFFKRSMSEEERNRFAQLENEILKRKEKLVNEIQCKEKEIEEKSLRKEEVERVYNQKRQMLMENAQNKHIYELSAGIEKIMSSLLTEKTKRIREQLEEKTVENLSNIYRKNNLITRIELEENFEFGLFQKVSFCRDELSTLISNLGITDFERSIGHKGIQELCEELGVEDTAELRVAIMGLTDSEVINTYKRIELSRLSKGERQIFILALYWAIIQTAGQDIPFVIDTPYARIDANHRKEISEKFFPSISKQVIILSTDEEINDEYYQIVRPFVAKEYLLQNDSESNKTTVSENYFFEVSK